MSELEARPPADREPAEGVTAAVTLAGLPLAGRSATALERTRLSPMVAAALRSALDALLGDPATRRPLTVASDDAVLDLLCPSIDPAGLRPAGAMLEMIDGQLGATFERGTWSVRVPAIGLRPSYLMVEQGTLKLAVPWHSVARVRLVPNEMIESMARRQGHTVLSPIARAGTTATERPTILIGHGLRRAWMVADRLVWRMPADKVLTPETPGRELGYAVQTDDGEVFWVVDPARILRDVELPPLPDPAPRAPAPSRAPAAQAPAPKRARVIELRRPEVEPLGEESPSPPAPAIGAEAAAIAADAGHENVDVAEVAEPATERPTDAPVADEPRGAAEIVESDADAEGEIEAVTFTRREVDAGLDDEVTSMPGAETPAPTVMADLGEESVERLDDPAAPVSSEVQAASPAPRRRRALVAEDSITARIFLVRLLEQEGFEVHDVATAGELHALLERGPWSVVFVDVELPDAHGLGHLIPWTAGPPRGLRPFPVVALVRDRADETMAEEAGVHERLPKPFERDVLVTLLDALGLGATA